MDQTTGDIRSSDPYIEPIPSTEGGAAYSERVAAGDDATYAELVERDSTGGVTDDESTDDIRGDIEQTRATMSGTIDAIQDRLSPQRLTQQAKDAVRDATIGRVGQTMDDMTESAREGGYTLLDTIRLNPIPAALAGIGVGWLIMKVRENAEERSWRNQNRYAGNQGRYSRLGGSDRQYGSYPSYQSRSAGAYYSGSAGQMSQQGSDQSLSDKAQDKMGQVADKAQDTMGRVTDKAQDMGGQLQDQAQQQAYRVKGWFERTMDDNPLAIGLVAVAAGALAGMAVPETDQERQWMGPARDQLVDKAQDIAQDTANKAQSVAKQATDAAKDAGKNEAKNQNLIH